MAKDTPDPTMASAVDAMLGSLGLVRGDARGGAEQTVQEHLDRRGLDARVVSLRWGELAVEATSTVARMVEFERDVILAAVEQAHPGLVRHLVVRIAPRR